MTAPLSITAIILSYNEELHIRRCIERLRPLCERIVVIDSYSTDNTVEIARELGAEVFQNPFRSHADQFDWGMTQAAVTSDWTLRVDCDEYLEPEAQAEIRAVLTSLPDRVTGIDLRLKVYFRGKWIRWGGYYQTNLMRLWRTGKAEIERRWMDERMLLLEGDRIWLRQGNLVDENLNDIGWWVTKHNGYATKHMIHFLNIEHRLFSADERLGESKRLSDRWKQYSKNNLYAKCPLYLRAFLYFVLRYFVKLGFIDGRRGFLWHFMQAFWYQTLIDAKIDEGRSYIRAHGVDAFVAYLATHHGVSDISPTERNG